MRMAQAMWAARKPYFHRAHHLGMGVGGPFGRMGKAHVGFDHDPLAGFDKARHTAQFIDFFIASPY